MRRQFNWLVLAVTSLLVVAFVIPLGLLVRRQAEERAQVTAEQRAQSAAAALAVAVANSDQGLDRTVAESALVSEVAIVLPGGTTVGRITVPRAFLPAVHDGSPTAGFLPDGSWAVGLPVATPEGFVAVLASASVEEMRNGVWRATLLLAALAVALIIGAVLMADRLGRSLVQPVTRLGAVATRLSEGDLSARAETEGPPEMQSVAAALNTLAGRLGDIIAGEREALADLSHRLRTPLTSLRLQAEKVAEPQARSNLVDQVDRTQQAVDQLVADVRNRGREVHADFSNLIEVVADRVRFWKILADEQGRRVDLTLPDTVVTAAAPETEVAAALDALIGNVFAHTPQGVDFSVEVSMPGGVPTIVIGDEGPGFDPGVAVMDRGTSGGGSTGLGLDIARRLGERLGGGLETGKGPSGGALVRLRLGG